MVNGVVVQSDFCVSSISIPQRLRQIKRLRDRESLTTINIYLFRDLQSSAKRFMKRNFEDVCRTEDFQELSVEDVEDLISSDNIYVQTEETVVEAIQLWLSKDTNLRQQHVQRLIQHVKLTNLSTDSVSKLVQNNMITSNEKQALEEDGLTVKSRS